MKLLLKFIVIIFALFAVILLTLQITGKKTIVQAKMPKNKNSITEHDKEKLIPSDEISKNIPDLKGDPEDLKNHNGHIPTFNHVFYSSNNKTLKQVALTFDDGPDEYFTPQILQILRQNNIKATFFIIGSSARAHPEIVRQIVNEGHSIGNHTWNHPVLSKLSLDNVKEEVLRTEQELFNITGIKTAMFRPPYGIANSQIVGEISSLGYNIIDWSVDTRDWAKTPVPQIMNYVSKQIYPGGIILQHCAGRNGEDLSNTVRALPEIINSLKKQGYNFVTLRELLNIPDSK